MSPDEFIEKTNFPKEKFVCTRVYKDRLLVFFEKSVWALRYTGNQELPFVWEKINSDFRGEPITVIHPGEFIKEEIEARGWSPRDLAYIISCPEKSIKEIIKGKSIITPHIATALSIAFEVSPELFTNLQQAYDLAN